jgi:hypothetical protein
MPKDPQDYEKNKAYYLAREASPEGVRKRVVRAQARTAAIKSGALTGKSDAREIDHKRSLSKGGGNGPGNTRVTSTTANRRKYDH